MKMINKAIIAICLAPIGVANATYCDFDYIKAPTYELGQIDGYQRFENQTNGLARDSYQYLFQDGVNLKQSDVYGNKIKITSKKFKFEKETDANSPTRHNLVRVYSAIMDDCSTINLRIPQSNSDFEKYFKLNDYRVSGDFDFDAEQHHLDLININDLDELRNHIGKNIYFGIPNNETIAVKKNNTSKSEVIENYKPYKLVKVVATPVIIDGKSIAPLTLEISNGGSSYKAPYIKGKVYLSDPLRGKNIRSEFVSNIKKGVVSDGMNIKEVSLSLGIPDLVRVSDIYVNSLTKGQLEIGDSSEYHLTNIKLLDEFIKTNSKYSYLYYSKIMFDGDRVIPLVFDENKIFRRDLQNNALYNSRQLLSLSENKENILKIFK